MSLTDRAVQGNAPYGSREDSAISKLILDLLKCLQTNLTMQSNLALDNYRTALAFDQDYNIVSGGSLKFQVASLTKLRDGGFRINLQGGACR
ncbi:hypothetical protein OC846_006093 [Tilletia horrida]|uniref:Uncharacterized protein n=1 Tax=Tilletia horrida TaxID=155126 RepID=A0AAN6GJI9_9BASI|nr:hypothetical protein OC846_006093 [Tilletia horrida]